MLNKLAKISALISVVLIGSGVLADENGEQNSYPTFGIETRACSFNEGKDLDDLLEVSEAWSQWATDTSNKPYSAWIFMPMFYNKAPSHDVYWLGTSESMTSLGAVQDQWLRNGGKYQKAFSKVVTCDSHTVFEGQMLRNSLASLASGNAQFFACSFKDTATPEKFVAGTEAFRRFVDTLGLEEAVWRWWPSAGHFGQSEWNFLEVVGSGSLEQRFANKAKYSENNGDAVWVENNGDILQCAYVADANYIQVK